MNEIQKSVCLPVLALRGMTVFPGVLSHFDVGRQKSILAINEAMNCDQMIFMVTQVDITDDDPNANGLCKIGTVAYIKQMLRLPGDVIRILVEGRYRATLGSMIRTTPYLYGRVEPCLDSPYHETARTEATIRKAYRLFEQFSELVPRISPDVLLSLLASQDPGYIADVIAQNATFGYQEKQSVLEELNPQRRLELTNRLLTREIEVLQYEADLDEHVHESISQGQRDYYLREQMKVIRTELGEDDEEQELEEYNAKIKSLQLDEEIEEKLLKEVNRLSKQPAGSSEAAVIRNYLDICLELPWKTRSNERVNLDEARRILDRDHYGLEKVKERILETLAVRKLAPLYNGQILCLVGPPGVGKTSIAMSIAHCLNRKLARISLGGVHDEADIRGHRKTYIGAMPGRIIEGIRQAGTCNPVLVLDEIDKMGTDYRGDPSSALLEVLDSEQNATFRDHFLEIPFDLSECMFITTANTTDTIPRALLDRMEVIEIGSYTDEEKLMIAKRHLLPKQIKKHGLIKSRLRVSDTTLRAVITGYTRESGVRNLERELAGICRKAAMRFASEPELTRITVKADELSDFLGVRKYDPEVRPESDQVGLVTGLAWTAVGGTVLEVEANVLEGSGKLILTGNLGKVMEESATAALSYIRTRASALHIPEDFYKTKDIHIHFPEGAVPKDGPSAGITVCTAMVSALTGAPVRRDIAMTGEISIRGRVLPIGGLKEKTMAALRYGVRTVIIPKENEKDLEEIDQTVRNALEFIPVSQADTVLDIALDFSHCKQRETVITEPLPELGVPVKKQPKTKASIRQ
jgi:ATP-dependent Lon protease